MSYSRRQLYAFGEPLGESITRKEGGRVVCGDGGGGSSAPSTTTQVSELPDWAKGYAKDTLAKTAALTDVNQNPYQAYGAERIAGFSPMQQQAQQKAAGMQTSGATGFGTQLAGAAGLGALGASYDPTQFQAGQFGGQEAQQYMSPYMQNVVDIQQREAQRQGDIAGTQRGAQAVKSGAFGGGRQAIMEAEAARNLATQKGDIQAQGLQSSYQQAQAQFNADQARRMQAQQLAEQSKQYGAGYGMQGLQTALQGAGQLGALGQQEFGQGMDINKLQAGYGAQQQALQQQGLTQAYQDFQNQQNYPYKQLGFMSDMIRGLPLGQQSTQQVYEAEPGMAQQIGSIGMGAMGLSKFMAEGGEVKSYKVGGGVDSQENVADIVDSLSPQQMAKGLEAAQARGDMNQIRAIQDEMGFQASLKRGLAGTVTPDMAQRMAGGGAVAFAKGGTPSISEALERMRSAGSYTPPTSEETVSGIQAQMPGLKSLYGESKTAPYTEEVKAERAALKAGRPEDEAAGWFAGAEGMLKGRGIAAGLANALPAFGKEVIKMKQENRKADQLLRASEIQLATADQARADGMVGKATELENKAQTMAQKAAEMKSNVAEKEATIAATIRGQDVQAATSAAASAKPTDLDKQTRIRYEAALEAGEPANKATMSKAAQQAASDLGRYPGEQRAAAAEDKLNQAALQKAREAVDSAKMYDPAWKAAKTAKDSVAMERRESEMIAQRMKAPATGAAAAPSTTPIKIANKAEFDKLPSGTSFIAPDGSIRTKP
jgi:hypothetical protein